MIEAKCDDNPCKWLELTNSWTEKVKKSQF